MREDVVLPTTARQLASEGLVWEPQIGDWCTLLAGAYLGEERVGIWLVIAAPPSGPLSLVDAAGRWPVSRVPPQDCLWLPTAGKLKTWLRARGYRVTTGEMTAPQFASAVPALRHLCRLTRPESVVPIDGEGVNEAEAVADALLRVLGADTAGSARSAW